MHIFDLINLYRRRGGKATEIVVGYDRFAAAILLLAGDRRLATPHSRIQVHLICAKSLSLNALANDGQLKRIRTQMQKTQHAIAKVLAKRSGKSPETVNAMLQAGSNMTAAGAFKAGLVDGIADETIPTA